MASEEAQKQDTLATANAPVLESLYSDPDIVKKFPYTPKLLESIQTAKPRPKAVQYGDVTLAIQDAAYGALQGQTQPDAALQALQAKLQTLISSWFPQGSRRSQLLRRELSAFLKGGSRMATATAEPRSVPATEGDGHKHKKNALSDGQGRLAWILLAPTLIVIAVVAGIPVVMSIREAFFQTNTGVDPTTGMIAGGEQFVGLQNFANIFAGQNPVPGTFGTIDRFWNAFLNTTFITIVCVILETILGVAMALIMAKAFRGRGLVRAGILVPWAIPTIVSALMWKLIFDSSGVANRILGREILWLADTGASFWAIVIADTWKTAAFIGLLTLAGLQTIPAEVYEAAKVDGATTWQQFVRITLRWSNQRWSLRFSSVRSTRCACSICHTAWSAPANTGSRLCPSSPTRKRLRPDTGPLPRTPLSCSSTCSLWPSCSSGFWVPM